MSRTRALVGGVAALAVVLTACGGPPVSGSAVPPSTLYGQPTATVTQTQTETATATATATPAAPAPDTTVTVTETAPPAASETTEAPTRDATPIPAPDLVPYTDSEIRGEVADAVQVTDTYWRNLFTSWDAQWRTPGLYHGTGFVDSARGEGYTCNEYDPEPNAGACGRASGTELYWNMELFRRASYIGDGIYYVTVAHEYGHAGQYRFMDDGQGLAVPTSDTGMENQADCIAGATLAKAEKDGYLTFRNGDLDEITEFLVAVADGTGGHHGTADQRVGMFHLGYDNADIESCLFNRGVAPPGWIGPR